MTTQVPGYWPMLEAYHRARESLYHDIITEVFHNLPPGATILDAGCGDAFYSRLIADIVGPHANILAVDYNPSLLPAKPGLVPSIHFCVSDLEQIGAQRAVFDAIWLCRAMHSAPDPLRRLAALVPLLRPGQGKLVVIENDFAHYPIFSWPADFEHRLLEAHYQYLQSRCPDGRSLERYHAARHLPEWLAQIGLCQISIHTYASEDVAPLPTKVETYWRLFMDWESQHTGPFLSPEDRETYNRACNPSSPDYLLRRPGFYSLELTTVACGIAP